MEVHPDNTVQLTAWDGAQGEFWAERAAQFDRAMIGYHEHLMAEVRAGELVLDIGCGSGTTTREAARRGAGALGIDLSTPMLGRARQAAGEGTAEFVRGDAQVYPFPAERFDLAISRHGSMFFADPVAAFANIAAALKPGGRLALVVWQAQELNEFRTAVQAALGDGKPLRTATGPGPFSLADPDRVREVLGAAGFADIALRDLREPMCFGDDEDEAYEYLSAHYGGLTEDYDEEAKTRAFAALRADVAAHLSGDGVCYGSAAWLVTAIRGRGR